jgi:hypothetical protein
MLYDAMRASSRFAAIVGSLGPDVALFTSPSGGRPRYVTSTALRQAL